VRVCIILPRPSLWHPLSCVWWVCVFMVLTPHFVCPMGMNKTRKNPKKTDKSPSNRSKVHQNRSRVGKDRSPLVWEYQQNRVHQVSNIPTVGVQQIETSRRSREIDQNTKTCKIYLNRSKQIKHPTRDTKHLEIPVESNMIIHFIIIMLLLSSKPYLSDHFATSRPKPGQTHATSIITFKPPLETTLRRHIKPGIICSEVVVLWFARQLWLFVFLWSCSFFAGSLFVLGISLSHCISYFCWRRSLWFVIHYS
jgi:hypothetical protein